MKKLILLILLLALFATPALAGWDMYLTARHYMNDELMLSMRPGIKNASGLCNNIGADFATVYGTTQPILFASGIYTQSANSYATACNSLATIGNEMTADDVRALSYLLGRLLVVDAKNHPSTTLNHFRMLYAAETEAKGFSEIFVLRYFIELSTGQPDGYPQDLVDFLTPIFHGNATVALNALRATRPSVEVKTEIAKIANAK